MSGGPAIRCGNVRSGPHLALEGAAAAAAYAVLALALFHPLFADPSRTVVNLGPAYTADVNLVMWVLAWDWHALTTGPWSLFDANIFHPAPNSLASSEHMLGHVPLFGPVYALSGNPVLANQINVLLCFALSGAALYALLRHWGVAAPAAFFGGFVYAFCPLRSFDVPHAHLLAGQYLPLALLFLDRTLQRPRLGGALALAVCLLLHMLCSYYLAYMGLAALLGYGAGVLWWTRGRLPRRAVLLILSACVVVGAVFALLSAPYLELRGTGVVPDHERTGFAYHGSADAWRNFLVPPVAFRKWDYQLPGGISVYVGVVPLACALLGFFSRRRRVAGPIGWSLGAVFGLTLASYVMMLGPEVRAGEWSFPLPYRLAMDLVPGFASMRVPSRFGYGLMLGIGALSGIGAARLLGLLQSRRRGLWLAGGGLVLLMTGTALEYDLLTRPLKVRAVAVGGRLPAVYGKLAKLPPGPVLELPARDTTGSFTALEQESEYMLYSTFHWQRLLNGYSGYRPPSYDAVMPVARLLPDPRASELLVRLTGLRYVVVHRSELLPQERLRWNAPERLRELGSFGTDVLYGVVDPPRPDLVARLIDFRPADVTVLGTPLRPLPPEQRRAEVELVGAHPRTVRLGFPFLLELEVTNRSSVTWPALSPSGDHLVTLAYRWENEAGEIRWEKHAAARLPCDLAAGESVRTSMTAIGHHAGTLVLTVGVAQDGQWFGGAFGPLTIRVEPWPSPSR